MPSVDLIDLLLNKTQSVVRFKIVAQVQHLVKFKSQIHSFEKSLEAILYIVKGDVVTVVTNICKNYWL